MRTQDDVDQPEHDAQGQEPEFRCHRVVALRSGSWLRPSLIRLGFAECLATVGPEPPQVEVLAQRLVEECRFRF